jgi:PKD repeat protein
MKKVLRLVSVCLIPGLMFIFFNVALAGSPAKSGMGEYAVQTGYHPGAGRSAASRQLLQIAPISGLSVTHTSPAFANVPTFFTATVTGGTPPIFYAWSFGDNTSLPGTSNVVSHTYALTGNYTVVVTAFNVVGPVAQTVVVPVIDLPYRAFLPIILKGFVTPLEPADLLCSLNLFPPAPTADKPMVISVQLENKIGTADGFWVDLYINPTTVPTTGHLIPWQQSCGTSPCPHGIAWGISDNPLGPGITRTLISIPNNFHPNGFDPAQTSWTGSLPAGTYDLYAYADSIQSPVLTNTEGAVFETNEGNNRCEILDLVIPVASAPAAKDQNARPLPARPAP